MEIPVGTVTHFYSHLGVAALALTREIDLGDSIHFLGHTTDFEQQVSSLEINHHKVQRACPGQDVAIRVNEIVRRGDVVMRIAREESIEALGL